MLWLHSRFQGVFRCALITPHPLCRAPTRVFSENLECLVYLLHQLMQGRKMVADDFAEVTVLFCEICNFHSFASRYSPRVVVSVLNVIYSKFDSLIDKYKVHKVRCGFHGHGCVVFPPRACTVMLPPRCLLANLPYPAFARVAGGDGGRGVHGGRRLPHTVQPAC